VKIFKNKNMGRGEYKNSSEEIEANQFASNNLIDKFKWERFSSSNSRFSETEIIRFSQENKIHPSIVRGRICHTFNFYKAKTSIDYAIY
jgi:HTH-type transcriptional regulator / antitoxin HigA